MSGGRGRLAWRVAVREVTKNKGRFLLAALVIALVIAVAVAGDTVYRSRQVSPARQAQWQLGSNAAAMVEWYSTKPVQQTPDLIASVAGQDPIIPGLNARLAAAFPGHPTAELRTEGVIMRSATSVIDYSGAIEGNLNDPLLTGLFATWRGSLPSAAGEVTLRRADAKTLGVSVGDTIEISIYSPSRSFVTVRVVGIHQNAGFSTAVGLAAGTIPANEAIPAECQPRPVWFLGGGPVSWHDVLAGNDAGFITASRAAMLDPPPIDQVPLYQDQGWQPYDASAAASILVLAFLVIGGVLVVLLIGPVFTIGARRSRRDYALLRAQGATGRDIRAIMLRSSGLVGAAASVVGVLLGVCVAAGAVAVSVAAGMTWMPDVRVGWLDMPAIAGIGTLIALIASWVPARSATREDLVLALRDQETNVHKVGRARPLLVLAGVVITVVTGAVALLRNEPTWLLVPAVIGALTLVMTVRLALVGLAAVAPRLPLSARVTVRDAARRADRTVPAATVVTAAVAAAVCAGVVMSTQAATDEAAWALPAKAGSLMILDGDYLAIGDDFMPPPAAATNPAQRDQLKRAIEEVTPVTQMMDVNALFIDGEAYPMVVIDPSLVCPSWADNTREANRRNGLPKNEGFPAKADSENCFSWKAVSSRQPYAWQSDGGDQIIVDDGTLVKALGLPGADKAAAALAAGKIVATRSLDMWSDGTVHVGVFADDPVATTQWNDAIAAAQADGSNAYIPAPPPITKATIVADAVLVDMPSRTWEVFVPPSLVAAAPLSDQSPTVRRVGVVATTDGMLGSRSFDELRSAVSGVGVSGVYQATPYDDGPDKLMLAAVIAAAALFAFIITWGASRLALADMRPDLRVIHDVGATGRVRRRIAGLMTLTVGMLGSLTGVAAGLLLGLPLVAISAANQVGQRQVVAIPWLAIALIAVVIPLATAGLSWLLALRTSDRK